MIYINKLFLYTYVNNSIDNNNRRIFIIII